MNIAFLFFPFRQNGSQRAVLAAAGAILAVWAVVAVAVPDCRLGIIGFGPGVVFHGGICSSERSSLKKKEPVPVVGYWLSLYIFSNLKQKSTSNIWSSSSASSYCLRRMSYQDYITPAFFKVRKAPFLLIVLMPFAESTRVMDFLSSGMYIFFFWKLADRRTLPQGLNCVARVRLLYRPPMSDDLFVTGQVLINVVWLCYHVTVWKSTLPSS
jgi:hypothetical protein